MQIKEAILHQLIKVKETSGDGCVEIKPRTARLPADEMLNETGLILLDAYGKNVSGYGTLGADVNLHRFPVLLGAYDQADAANADAFIHFTSESLNLIAEQMKSEFFATGGYVLTMRYTSQAEDWLMVVMLKLKEGAGIDPVTMDLKKTLTLDTTKLHEAARVNLTKWRTNTQPYLSFVKPKGSKVSDYFRKALACMHFTDAKHHTSQVISALTEFINTNAAIDVAARPAKLIEARQSLFKCFDENKTEVLLDTISAFVMPDQPHAFKEFVRNDANAGKWSINDAFKPDKSTYSSLKRIKGKIGTVSVAFDVADVKSKRVRYDPETNSLVLAKPTNELIQEIQRYDNADNPVNQA